MKPKLQSGVALVITLLMLSVITFLTVAFLAVSRRDRESSSTSSNRTIAHNMADVSQARAFSEIAVHIIAQKDLLSYDLMVSKNYINPLGFQPGVADPTNVNYDYDISGNPLTAADKIKNIGNLLFDPRPPVFVKTNANGSNDFRFWYDINHNGLFEDTGYFAVTNDVGVAIVDTNNSPNLVTNYFLGDPQWIGVLKNPELPHAPNNQFIGRYFYLVQPIGKTLDINFIHNYAKGDALGMQPNLPSDGFLRNQGFGSWEINLAAFLRDLNTSAWDPNSPVSYNYSTLNTSSVGPAFDDARAMVYYRYGGNFKSQTSITNLFSTSLFASDGFDGLSDGPLATSSAALPTQDGDDVTLPWSGSNNTNSFYDMQELFDTAKSSNFVTHLQSVINKTNTFEPSSYNRYTFQRLLGELGTDSDPELQVDVFDDKGNTTRRTKVNINYDNTAQIKASQNTSPPTMIRWTPLGFFTNAAELMLRSQGFLITNGPAPGAAANLYFGATNIWIYSSTNASIRYSEAIHRLLQVAANIYDATTNESIGGVNFPSVFKPIFSITTGAAATNVYIVGYTNIQTQNDVFSKPFRSLNNPINLAALLPDDNIFGIPLIIGAKKGLPNFNECSYANLFAITRKLQFVKTDPAVPPTMPPKQMFLIGISNVFGVELWNSYSAKVPRPVRIIVTNQMQITLTNETGLGSPNMPSNTYIMGTNQLIAANTWLGWQPGKTNGNSFQIPLLTNINFLPQSQYLEGSRSFLLNSGSDTYETSSGLPVHDWGINVTNHLWCVLIDEGTGRLLDFVSLDFGDSMNVTTALTNHTQFPLGDGLSGSSSLDLVWNPAGANFTPGSPMSIGVSNQIQIAQGILHVNDWNPYYGTPKEVYDEISDFNGFMSTNNGETFHNCPFQPTAIVLQRKSYQANDPLVHYTTNDLTRPKTNDVHVFLASTNIGIQMRNGDSLGGLNPRYNPWKWQEKMYGIENYPTDAKIMLKDPLITQSDDWNFSTNQFPSVGWLGRVHRGTPWQTVYFKSENPDTAAADRTLWTSEWVNMNTLETFPINDWRLVDLFTVAPNDNAARGSLSVNQTNLPPWSAILSGVIALTNDTGPVVIDPTTTNVSWIVDGSANSINTQRASNGNKLFHSVGDILAAPNLTIKSPYLTPGVDVSDAVIERIPQQILSLLKLGQPRFVIYAFGQSLKPAANGLATGASPPYFNLCTNYQIVGESATRTVCHVEGTATNPKVVIDNFNILPGD